MLCVLCGFSKSREIRSGCGQTEHEKGVDRIYISLLVDAGFLRYDGSKETEEELLKKGAVLDFPPSENESGMGCTGCLTVVGAVFLARLLLSLF